MTPSRHKTPELAHKVIEKSSINKSLIYETQLIKFYCGTSPLYFFFNNRLSNLEGLYCHKAWFCLCTR